MKFLVNKRLAARIGIITTAITLVGMLFLWGVVSTNAAAMVESDITNQMVDAVDPAKALEPRRSRQRRSCTPPQKSRIR